MLCLLLGNENVPTLVFIPKRTPMVVYSKGGHQKDTC